LKDFDWNVTSITAYKFFRFFILILVVVYQNLLNSSGSSEIAFFGTIFALMSGMLQKVVERAEAVRKESKSSQDTHSDENINLSRFDY